MGRSCFGKVFGMGDGTYVPPRQDDGSAYAQVKAQAIRLMNEQNRDGNPALRFDEAMLKVVCKPENRGLCEEWRKDLGFPVLKRE